MTCARLERPLNILHVPMTIDRIGFVMPYAHDAVRAVVWREDALELLDQRLLPTVERYRRLTSAADVAQAIRDMVVRGAPAIGIAAAYGVVCTPRPICRGCSGMADDGRKRSCHAGGGPADRRQPVLGVAADGAGDRSLVRRSGGGVAGRGAGDPRRGSRRQPAHGAVGRGVAGRTRGGADSLQYRLAGHRGYGTALGVIREGYAAGLIERVYADETRPWLQGFSRLTALGTGAGWHSGDAAGGWSSGGVDAGGQSALGHCRADRIAANGDVANKIGTYHLAVAARYHGVRFMVVAPASTVDMNLVSGAAIPIEQRAPRSY